MARRKAKQPGCGRLAGAAAGFRVSIDRACLKLCGTCAPIRKILRGRWGNTAEFYRRTTGGLFMVRANAFGPTIVALAATLIAANAEARPIPRDRPAAAVSVEQPVGEPMPDMAEAPRPRHKPAEAVARLRDAERAAEHEKQAMCLAKAIYFEARSEPLDGQFAVARVVLNRTASRRYPDTICGVVFQNAHRKHRCQFSFACDGKPDDPGDATAWALARGIAEALLRTDRPRLPEPVLRSTHYHAQYVRPSWSRKLTTTGQVGQHIFYVSSRREQSAQLSAPPFGSH
jgi:spore germination cell wall hydrolase CwlJ-like protein